MIPFLGESVGIDDAVGATALYDNVRRRGGIGGQPGAATLTSGDEWRVWVYDGSQTYLEDDTTDVAVSWVVEVASGSATVTASTAPDPDYGDPGAAHGTSLGTHAVTAGTLVLPTSYTAADVMSGGAALMLVLEPTAGAIVVQQIKLRVWPTAGVGGGWSDLQPSFNTGDAAPLIYRGAALLEGLASTPDPDDAWDAAVGLLQGSADGLGPHDFTTVGSLGTFGAQGVIANNDGINRDAAARVYGQIHVAEGPDPSDEYPIAGTLVEEVDFARPPEEVADDDAYLVQSTGTPFVEWATADAALTVHPSGAVFGGPTVSSTGTDTLDVTHLGGSNFRIDVDLVTGAALTTHPATGDPDTTLTVPLSGSGRFLIVSLSHTFYTDGGAWPGPYPTFVSSSVEHTAYYDVALDLSAHVVMPPYRVWSPVAVEVTVSKVRQFHRDDGLGVTPPRAFGGASRIRTGRAYGYD